MQKYHGEPSRWQLGSGLPNGGRLERGATAFLVRMRGIWAGYLLDRAGGH